MNCKICGENSGKYPLCKKCNELKEQGLVIKCEKCDEWHLKAEKCTKKTAEPDGATLIYELKNEYMTKSEQSYYNAILSVLPENLKLFPQANLSTVINKTDNSPFHNELYRNVDFLITDNEFKPLIFIEINDQSHTEKARKERDQKVKFICEEAGIPIITLWTNYGINAEYIKKRIDETLASLPIKRISHVHSKGKKEEKKGCYIATCVYGSYDTPELWILRRYRDNVLAKSIFGRLFINLYYSVSPKMVELFGKTKWFNVFFKKKLDKIVVKLQQSGIENKPYKD